MYSYDLFGATQAREHTLLISEIETPGPTPDVAGAKLGGHNHEPLPINPTRRPTLGRAILYLATYFLTVGLVLISLVHKGFHRVF